MIQLLLHIYIYINKHLYHRQPKQFRTLPQNSCFDKQSEYIFRNAFHDQISNRARETRFHINEIQMYKTEKLQRLETKFQLIL